MPISVRDNSWAIGAGAQRAQNAVDSFNKGLTDASKGFEKGVVIGRLKQEEDEYMKRQRLQKALNENDTETIQKLLQDPWYKKLWSTIKGEGWQSQIDKDLEQLDQENRDALGNYHGKGMEGYTPAQTNSVIDNRNVQFTTMPETIDNLWDENGQIVFPKKEGEIQLERIDGSMGTVRGGSSGVINRLMPETIAEPVLRDRNEFLRKQAQSVVDDVPDTTVARAAETAGINTGYVPASQQDKANIEFAVLQGDKIISAYNSATTRRNGLAATIAQMEQVPEGQRFGEFNNVLKSMQNEYKDLNQTIRNLKDEGISKGLNPNFFIAGDGSGSVNVTQDPSKTATWNANWEQIKGKLTSTSNDADVFNALYALTGKEPTTEEVNHITKLNSQATDLQRKETQFKQGVASSGQGLQSGATNLQTQNAQLAGRRAELNTTLNLMNNAKTIQQKAAFLKGQDEASLRLGGVDVGRIAQLLGLPTYTKAQEDEINTQFEIMKSKLGAERNALGQGKQEGQPANPKGLTDVIQNKSGRWVGKNSQGLYEAL